MIWPKRERRSQGCGVHLLPLAFRTFRSSKLASPPENLGYTAAVSKRKNPAKTWKLTLDHMPHQMSEPGGARVQHELVMWQIHLLRKLRTPAGCKLALVGSFWEY